MAATLDQINARLENIERILNALYVPVIREEQRQIDMLPPKQQQAIARERRKHKLAAFIHEKQVLLHAKAFDQKTPERLRKSRAIMQSNAVKPLAIPPHGPERNHS